MEKRRTTYGELKMRKIELQNQKDDERKGDSLITQETLNKFWRTATCLKEAEKSLLRSITISLLVAILLLFSSGCTSSATVGVSSSLYYPKKWESPASRKQHTQPTVGMARNNLPMVGGVK